MLQAKALASSVLPAPPRTKHRMPIQQGLPMSTLTLHMH
jgi:hypothetical protein